MKLCRRFTWTTFNCLCCKIHTHIIFQRTNAL
uniref:Uncharacterized protein n=1 Tax=Anguilla anguilla TaxID=7936 RepID=A0A0E9PTL2_ANGAN